MARDNLTWGQRRIANELRLKLGLRVSPRTVRKYMPTYRDRAPGGRVQSQRWRTFMRNHAWDLIIHGVAVDLTRDLQAWSTRLMRSLRRWWGQAVASRMQGLPQRDAISIALLHKTVSGPIVWSPGIVHVCSVADRGPPDMKLSHHHAPCTATHSPQVDTVFVRPTVAVLCEWHKGAAHSRGTQLLCHSETQSAPWQRVA
jgi:hypothetical protein